MADTSEYAETFALIDTDGDGKISKDEFAKLITALGADGSATGAEHAFDTLDGDDDGQITLEELAAYLASTGS